MITKKITDLEELNQLQGQWASLLLSTRYWTVFQHPDWVLSWWSTFANGNDLYCLATFDNKELVGLAPLMIQKRFGLRTVSFIGSGLNDYNNFIINPREFEVIRRLLLDNLYQNSQEWDILKLTELDNPPYSNSGGSFIPPNDFIFTRLRPMPSPKIELPNNWEGFGAKLPGKRRRDLQSRWRRLEASFSPTFSVTSSPNRIVEEISEFLAFRLRNWNERQKINELPTVQLSKRFTTFLSDCCSRLAKHGLVSLAHLKVENAPIASMLCLVSGSRFLCYLRAYDLKFGQYSPGSQLDLMLIRHAIQRDFKYFDYGRGDEGYKFWTGSNHENTENILVAPMRLSSMVLVTQNTAVDVLDAIRYNFLIPARRRAISSITKFIGASKFPK